MTSQITANDLKVKGVSAIKDAIEENSGAIITVHGIEKYIILKIEDYNKLREFELDVAIQESKNDIEGGKYFSGSIEDHIKRVTHV